MASTVPHADERNPDRARHFAFAAAALLFVSLFTPWWSVDHISNDEPTFHGGHRINVFEDGTGIADDTATLATGLLVAIALAWVAWGLLAQSWRFEPGRWRRDVISSALFTIAAIVSMAWWPPEGGSLFGAFDLAGHDGVATATRLDAGPAMGWVIAGIALICLAVSLLASQKREG